MNYISFKNNIPVKNLNTVEVGRWTKIYYISGSENSSSRCDVTAHAFEQVSQDFTVMSSLCLACCIFLNNGWILFL